MGELKNRTKFTSTLDHKTFDTVARMSYETMIDRTKLINKAIDEYLEKNGYEIRLNTNEENAKIFPKKNRII